MHHQAGLGHVAKQKNYNTIRQKRFPFHMQNLPTGNANGNSHAKAPLANTKPTGGSNFKALPQTKRPSFKHGRSPNSRLTKNSSGWSKRGSNQIPAPVYTNQPATHLQQGDSPPVRVDTTKPSSTSPLHPSMSGMPPVFGD